MDRKNSEPSLSSPPTSPTTSSRSSLNMLDLPKHDAHYGAQERVAVSRYALRNKVKLRSPSHKPRLVRRPVLRQFWLQGVLMREEETHATSWSELFFDLVFVSVIAELAHDLREELSGVALAKFLLEFTAVWRVWYHTLYYLNRFHTEDVVHRLFFIGQMLAVVAIGITASFAFSEEGYVGFALGNAASKLLLLAMEVWVAVSVNQARQRMLVNAAVTTTVMMVWLVSTLTGYSVAPLMWVVALFIEFAANVITPRVVPAHMHLPVNIEHATERFGLFTIITLGEIIVGLVHVTHGEAISATFAADVFGVFLAFALLWLYIDVDVTAAFGAHAIRHKASTGLLWQLGHWPLHTAMVLAGSGLELLIAAIAADSHSDDSDDAHSTGQEPLAGDAAEGGHTYDQTTLRFACWSTAATLFWLTVLRGLHGNSYFYPSAFKGRHRAVSSHVHLPLRFGISIMVAGLSEVGQDYAPLTVLAIISTLCVLVAILEIHANHDFMRRRYEDEQDQMNALYTQRHGKKYTTAGVPEELSAEVSYLTNSPPPSPPPTPDTVDARIAKAHAEHDDLPPDPSFSTEESKSVNGGELFWRPQLEAVNHELHELHERYIALLSEHQALLDSVAKKKADKEKKKKEKEKEGVQSSPVDSGALTIGLEAALVPPIGAPKTLPPKPKKKRDSDSSNGQ